MPAPRGDDARLHREAARRDRPPAGRRGRAIGERRSRRDAELRLDEVDARHLLGDGVLDLDARVALDEEVLAGLGRDEELDGAGVDVVGGARQLDRVVEDPLAEPRGRGAAPARSRSPSGCAAAPSSRARAGGRRCRARRPGSAPRCGAAGRSASRRRAIRRRTRPPPRCGSARTPRPSPPAASTRRMPRPPPPAAALSITG